MRYREKKQASQEVPLTILMIKALLGAYCISGILLVILALFLYKMNLGPNVIAIGIIVIYIVSAFLGGFVMGKYTQNKKYFWGMMTGVLYVVLLFAITLGVYRTLSSDDIVTTIILCTCSGTIGGMLA